ncbi:MAG: diguanylate cyclase [Phycisphaerae bacterium]|nr:diguanylate cyclase [Phycisphaerae bacterium]
MPGRPNVLLIGAAEGACAELASVLEAIGATIQPAGDCLTAMAAVKSDGIDLAVLADCGGEFNAVETARVLKSLRHDKYLPVMLLAAKGLPDGQPPAALEDGIDDILAPPFDKRVLEWRLQALLHLKSAHDQLRDVRSELQKTLARENALLQQLREDNRDLKARSTTDGLTALYNYRYLMEWLKTEFKVSRRYGHALSMIIVDIDFFKRINDEHGHPFGDLALKEVAVILKQCARESDLVARYAGDEFAIVCPRTGHKEVATIAKRILVASRKHRYDHKGQVVPIALSLGTATYPDDPEAVSPELLVFLADQALYQTKRQGRNGMTAWHEIDADTRFAVRGQLKGPNHPLLANDPKSRLELAAAARLVGSAAAATSFCLRPPEPASQE